MTKGLSSKPRTPYRPALVAVLIAALWLPASAFGQSAQSWVSGVGSDSNDPCSRTAPCQTFNGALALTAAGGEISVLDPGEFGPAGNTSGTGPVTGPVLITQSVTISAVGVTAGVIPATATDAIDIDAPGDVVILRGLDINGDGVGLDGIKVTAAATVRIEDSDIYGFTENGIEFSPTGIGAKLFVENSSIGDNGGDGVLIDPVSAGSATAALTNDNVVANGCGLVASSLGASAPFSTGCGTPVGGATTPAVGVASLIATNISSADNLETSVLVDGADATGTIGGDIVDGSSVGLQERNGGALTSLGDVLVFGNTTDGSPNATEDMLSGPPGPTGPTGPQAEIKSGSAGSAAAPRTDTHKDKQKRQKKTKTAKHKRARRRKARA
jgi:hypothetical protein